MTILRLALFVWVEDGQNIHRAFQEVRQKCGDHLSLRDPVRKKNFIVSLALDPRPPKLISDNFGDLRWNFRNIKKQQSLSHFVAQISS